MHASEMAGELGAVQCDAEEEAQRRGRAVQRRRLHTALGQMHLEAAHILCRCRLGRTAEELGEAFDMPDIVVLGLFSPNWRTAMSSSMRRRRSLMGFSLIGGAPVLRLEVANSSILKTEHPPRHPLPITQLPR